MFLIEPQPKKRHTSFGARLPIRDLRARLIKPVTVNNGQDAITHLPGTEFIVHWPERHKPGTHCWCTGLKSTQVYDYEYELMPGVCSSYDASIIIFE